ncbi:heme exporter protein CcmD (plasmid) [Rhizobium grahamii]|uniref:Heme exporter protein D n=2 Tax=Rhizobium grahamii TaxID=1120045 RepID=A0A5Q0CBE9_9HYPH|nr:MULTISPECIES: heme exporter protein CcmD [Rhizobium]QFY62772.1 heme exporter protein CcmD [Rhizobium grahamii]QRM52482.1 heme exporter protein CcmD [Rhizobium sp. BG6]
MNHEAYVLAAYAVTAIVLLATSAKVWIKGRSFRRRVSALASVRAKSIGRES